MFQSIFLFCASGGVAAINFLPPLSESCVYKKKELYKTNQNAKKEINGCLNSVYRR